MKEKDELKRKILVLKELLEGYNNNSVNKESNDNIVNNDNTPNQNISSKSLSKSLGAHPSMGNIKEDYSKTGYSSALMLSIIVFIFQVLFMFVSYLIFKP